MNQLGAKNIFFFFILICFFASGNSWGEDKYLFKSDKELKKLCANAPGHWHTNPDGSQGGWVQDSAEVSPQAYVGPKALVCEFAQVFAGARIDGEAMVFGRAQIGDNTIVDEDAQVHGSAIVRSGFPFDGARIFGSAEVYGNAIITEDSRIFGKAKIYGRARIKGDSRVCNENSIMGNTYVHDDKDSYCTLLPPVAHLNIFPTTGEASLFVQADASKSISTSGKIMFYTFDWGDGSEPVISGSPTQTHVYTLPGTYTFGLTVLDTRGGQSVSEQIITVTPSENPAPIASILVNTSADVAPLEVHFRGDTSSGNIALSSYLWDFGDGQTSTEINPVHLFTKIGSYTTTLTVTDSLGKKGSTNYKILVNCDQDEGDTFCPFFENHENRILTSSSAQFILKASPSIQWATNPIDLTINVIQNNLVLAELSGVVTITNDNLIIDKSNLFGIGLDPKKTFSILISGRDHQGNIQQGQINNLLLGTGSLSVTLSEPGVSVEFFSARYPIKNSQSVSGNSINYSDLPFDVYKVIARKDSKVAFGSIIIDPNTSSTLNLLLEEPFSPKFLKQNDIKKNKLKIPESVLKELNSGTDPDFTPIEIVFSPDVEGEISSIQEVEVPIGSNSVDFGIKLFSKNEIDDVYEQTLVFFDNSNNLQILNKTVKIKDFVEGSLSNWITQNLKISSTPSKRKVLVIQRSANLGRDNKPGNECQGAGKTGFTSVVPRPRIDYMIRSPFVGDSATNGNNRPKAEKGVEKFFATNKENFGSSGNPYYNRAYALEWTIGYTLPENSVFDSVSLRINGKEVPVTYRKFLNNTIVVDVFVTDIASRVTEFDTPDTGLNDFLLEYSSFGFRVSAKQTLTNGSIRTISSAAFSIQMIPLYNLKTEQSAHKCFNYSTVGSSMFAQRNLVEFLRAVIPLFPSDNDSEKDNRLLCNDSGMPFGGLYGPRFDGHGGYFHKTATGIDIRYFGKDQNSYGGLTWYKLRLEDVINGISLTSSTSDDVYINAGNRFGAWIKANRAAIHTLKGLPFFRRVLMSPGGEYKANEAPKNPPSILVHNPRWQEKAFIEGKWPNGVKILVNNEWIGSMPKADQSAYSFTGGDGHYNHIHLNVNVFK